MTYLDLIKNMSECPVRLITCATTGVKDDDQIISVSISNLEGPMRTVMIKDVPQDKIVESFPYHKITPELYSASDKADPSVLFNNLAGLSVTNVIFTYNVPFMQKMLTRLVNNETSSVVNLCDVAPVYQWIRSGQIFADNVPHTYEQIRKEQALWHKNRAPGIRTIIKDICTNWAEDETKITPENMIVALQEVFRWFGGQQVHSGSDSSETWEIQ